MLDPIADKLLIAAALMMLVYMDDIRDLVIIPALIILAREILVSGMREFLASIAVTVPVSSISKLKTAVQVVALAVLIVAPAIEHVWGGLHQVGIVALWVAAGLTIYTGFSYVQANVAHVSGEHARPRRRPPPSTPERVS
jgi:CDP-diacylglycerol--glycerol-3-phosphate 3-phosphatidyltransferase/cardiolipin synthase